MEIEVELEDEIESLQKAIEKSNKQKENIIDFFRDLLLDGQNQKVEALRQEQSITTEVELQDRKCKDELFLLGTKELLLLCTENPYGDLPTSCPNSLAMCSYLIFNRKNFSLVHHSCAYPDLIPYVQNGTSIAFHQDMRLGIQKLKDIGLNLDHGLKESSYKDLERGTSLLCDLLSTVLTLEMEEQRFEMRDKDVAGMQKIYKSISSTYEVFSTLLQDQTFFFGERPTSLDALFIGHALFVLHVLREESVLRVKLFEYPNLVKHAKVHGQQVIAVRSQSMAKISSLNLVMALGNGSSSHASGLNKGKVTVVEPEPTRDFRANSVMAPRNGSSSHASLLDKEKTPMAEPKPTIGENYGIEVPLSQVESCLE